MLLKGDTVGVVSPGFGVRAADLRAGVRRLEQLGFEVVTGEHALDRAGYFAGSDRDRAEDLARMITDPEIGAVWFSRGGYGSARLLERIDWKRLSRAPKTLVGYSDVTALFAAAIDRTECPCLYGPVVSELSNPRAYHLASLRRALQGESSVVPFARRGVVRKGTARGRLVGGNLAVLVHLLGTPYAPDLEGTVLFVEDVGEPVYRLDRMLTHLRMSGRLDGVRGVVIGSFEPKRRASFLKDRPVSELVRETFVPLGVPVVQGVRAGHVARKHTLVLGAEARLDTASGTLEVGVRRRRPRR